MDDLLEISGLTLRPAREALLSGFSLSVARGTIHAIVGPNGAGKTTLLSAILGLIPFEGRIVASLGRARTCGVRAPAIPRRSHPAGDGLPSSSRCLGRAFRCASA